MTPFIEVTVNGRPVNDAFYNRLIEARIIDAVGQDSDTFEATFDDDGNEIEMPPLDALITARFGYREGGPQKSGLFKVERAGFEGGDSGELLMITGRSAAMSSGLKEPLSEHFENTTIGQVMDELAARQGLQAVVSPSLRQIPVDYMPRLKQSTLDFGTRLADRYGALFAVKDNKLLFIERGSGTGSGQAMPTFTIDRSDLQSWSFDLEPRPKYGKVRAEWFDREAGKTLFEEVSTGLSGPVKTLRHAARSKAEAATAARSEAGRLARATGSGSITLAGRPELMAEANLTLTGMRAELAGPWRIATVSDAYSKEGFITEIELETPEGGV